MNKPESPDTVWCSKLIADCIFCCQSTLCKNLSRNIWIVAYYLLIHTSVCTIHSISNGYLNVQQCRRNTMYYFFMISPFQPQSYGRLRAFTSLWTVSDPLVVLPMPQLQFLNTLQFLSTKWFPYLSVPPHVSQLFLPHHT